MLKYLYLCDKAYLHFVNFMHLIVYLHCKTFNNL